MAAGATAVVVDKVVAGSPAPSGSAAAAAQVPFQTVGGAPVQASASLAAAAWGTRVDMRCTYRGSLDEDGRPWVYVLYATDRSGHTAAVAQWQALPDQVVDVPAAVAVSPNQLAALDVRSVEGTEVLHLSL